MTWICATTTLLEVRAALFDAFDLNAGEREQIGELGDVVRQFDKFARAS